MPTFSFTTQGHSQKQKLVPQTECCRGLWTSFFKENEDCPYNLSRRSYVTKNPEHRILHCNFSLIVFYFPSSADTWRSMRKSTTLARMMKKRSQGIPKPLFQSVQFLTPITTSNTVCQVGTVNLLFSRRHFLFLSVPLRRSLSGAASLPCVLVCFSFLP